MIQCGFDGGWGANGVTPLQNSFITQYLPKAPEVYLKVYLYGLMQCMGGNAVGISTALDISEAEAVEAFLYWQDMGLVLVSSTNPICVEYKSVTPTAGVMPERKFAGLIAALRKCCGTRIFTPQELSKIYDWINVFGMEEDAAVMLVNHCISTRGTNVRINYMDRLAKSWVEDGVFTLDAAESRIALETELQGGAKKILSRWRKSRMATEDELALYKKWTVEWGMSLDEILAACPAVTASDKPTFAYLNGILESMRTTGGVQEYFKNEDMIAELARQAYGRAGLKSAPGRREKDEISLWINSWHMSSELVLLAAEYASSSSRPFAKLRSIMEDWHKQGIVTVDAAKKAYETKEEKPISSSRPSYFMNYKQRRYTDEDIKQLGIDLLGEDD